jgi:outer membrane immunogenic protein
MKRLCFAFAGLAVLAALTSAALAADLGRPAPYYAPQYAPPPPPYSWTGFYVGVNGGGGFGNSNWDTTGSFNVSGALLGGTVGYNYQWANAVLGVEGDIDWSNIKGSTAAFCAGGCTTANSWLSTARGRIGYAAGRFMPYLTGGVAFGNIKASTPLFAGATGTSAGWTLGGGIEGAVVGNWSVKAEYLYVNLGSFNCGLNCSVIPIDNVSYRTSILRAGVNYRF